MDVVGGVLLADGRQAKVLTGIDDHSRFVVCAGLMRGRRVARCARTSRPRCGPTGCRRRS